MKNSKGKTLKQPYLAIAEMRRAQYGRTEEYETLKDAFVWYDTIEEGGFWAKVDLGKSPEIPAASLAELGEWRKAKADISKKETTEPDYKAMYERLLKLHEELQNVNQALVLSQINNDTPEPDWKAMYEELSQKVTELQKKYDENGYECSPIIKLQRMEQHFDAIKKRTSVPDRNWVAECAMKVANVLTADRAWDYAEAWAAEGKKRGHLPKTENA